MLADFRCTSLVSWHMALLAAGLAGATAALMGRRAGRRTLARSLAIASAAFILGCVALGVWDIDLLDRATDEGNVIESLTALFLLSAGIVTVWSAVRLHRQGRPSPGAMLLAVGFNWAFWRELEYGGNLIDGQFWFTRNIFRIESLLSPAYFERFRQKMDLSYSASTLYAAHLALTGLMAVVIALLTWYFIRHRRQAREECRSLTRGLHGRLFLLGAGLFIAAEAIGGALHKLDDWQLLESYGDAKSDLWHEIAEESLECWGAMVICFCAVALWKTTRQPVGLHVTDALRAVAKRRRMAASMPAASLMYPHQTGGYRSAWVRLTARRPEAEAERTESGEYSLVTTKAESDRPA